MTQTPAAPTHDSPGPERAAVVWHARARRVASVLLVAIVALTAYYVTRFFTGPDPYRPFTLLGVGFVPYLAVLLVAAVAAGAFALALRVNEFDRLLELSCAGLAIGVAFGGTIDDWLILQNPVPGPPSGSAYAPLLLDYVILGLLLGGGLLLARRKRALPAVGGADATQSGLVAMVTCAALAAALMTIFMGPRLMHTLRGQVYFTVGGAFFFATAMARSFTGVRNLFWYLPAPFLVGIVGVLLAAARPALGDPYDRVNVIPAWALVRPLPVEMVAVGLFGILWSLRAQRAISDATRSG